MKRFKHHNSGFTILEMMVALTLLATLGTSIFMIQSRLFSKITKAHLLTQITLNIDKELFEFYVNIEQLLSQKKSPKDLKRTFTAQNPHREITLQLEPINPASTLYSVHNENLYWIKVAIKSEQSVQNMKLLFYAPEPQEEPKNNTQNPSGVA